MPRYFYDLTDGSREPDVDGIEMPDHDTAVREAIRFLGEVLKEEPQRLAESTLRVDMRDEARRQTCVVEVSLTYRED